MTLAASTDGLQLADGRIVMPNGKIIDPNAKSEDEHDEDDDLIEVPTHSEAQALVVAARRKLSDLPAVPRTMNAISAIVSYTLFGLADEEIALAAGITVDQIVRIREQDAYVTMRKEVIASILAADTDNIRDLIAQQSRSAVGKLSHALAGKKVSALQVVAARDLLDRAGHRPADVVEHRLKLEGGLVIKVIRKDETVELPTINMEAV